MGTVAEKPRIDLSFIHTAFDQFNESCKTRDSRLYEISEEVGVMNQEAIKPDQCHSPSEIYDEADLSQTRPHHKYKGPSRPIPIQRYYHWWVALLHQREGLTLD